MKPCFTTVESTRLVHVSALPPLFRQRLRLEEAVAESPRVATGSFATLNSVQALIDLHYAVNLHRHPSRSR